MRHVSDGDLRARLDGELAEPDRVAVEQHLLACDRCRGRADDMARSVATFDALLSGQVAAEPQTDTARAFARLHGRRQDADSRPSFWAALLGRIRTPAWAAVAATLLLVLLMTSSPTRAIARKLLGIFRVKTVVAVPLEHDFMANGKGQLIADLLSGSTVVTNDEKPRRVASREEAAHWAGFAVRLPAVRTDAPRILRVDGARSFYLIADRQRAGQFLELVHRPDLRLPPELAGARVAVDIPRGVRAVYGECPDIPAAAAEPSRLTSCLDLLQVPSATVTTQPELDLAQLAEIGLQVSGMTPAQADAFSRTIDWTCTLAIPLPRESATYENVTVEGQRGVLVVGRQYANWPTRWSLLWVRQEHVYSMGGFGDPAAALPIAESLR